MRREHDGSTFVSHIPCPSCGSSDNRAVYTDGHEFCFSYGCPAPYKAGSGAPSTGNGSSPKRVAGLITDVELKGLRSRKISDETAKHFGYGVATWKGSTVQVAPYYDAGGRLVAQKIRTRDKDFRWFGNPDDALPFGANVFPRSGKMVVVTEGEIDALSMSQVQGNKWPVVSIASGAGPQIRKYIAKHREYFGGFEKVVLMFDQDDPGREAAKAAAEVLGSRAHIAELPAGMKDANDMLVAGRVEELVRAMWAARQYRPEGIVDMATLKDRVKQRPSEGLSWCFPELTAATYGKRLGEIVAVGAGTGVGKTDFLSQDMVHMVHVHGQKIGVFSLEQEVTETALRLTGKLAKRPLHIPDVWNEELFERTWDSLVQAGRIFLYDSFGVNTWEAIREKIEYLYHSEGVQYFYLDHLTALAAMEEDERKALEEIMADMGGLVKAIPIHITLVSHLATPEGKPHEEGGRVMIRHFKGSRAIGFWSHFMFGLERDQQSDDPTVRSTTTFRILKDRYTGRGTGATIYLGYDQDTGVLFVLDGPPEAERHGFRPVPEDDEDLPF